MQLNKKSPPRKFTVGRAEAPIHLVDCGTLYLDSNEQVTFMTADGKQYDVVRKHWGFYGTPSTNRRLKNFGFKTALMNSGGGLYYIWIVEQEKLDDFQQYAVDEMHEIVCWLDDEVAMKYLETINWDLECICGSKHFKKVSEYRERPSGETDFNISKDDYYRCYYQCTSCGHFLMKTDIPIETIYAKGYADSTYGEKLKESYEKVINLPDNQSDNIGRVKCLKGYADKHFKDVAKKSILDVGSGLCVFLDRVKKTTNWVCTALDPDPRQSAHARNVVGVKAIQDDFTKPTKELGTYDIITFNKVLEHVLDPVSMLEKAKFLLNPGGFIYVELPDGTMAMRNSYLREEFFIEHLHVFSMASIAVLGEKAGLSVLDTQRLIEPSGKYTLRAFLSFKN